MIVIVNVNNDGTESGNGLKWTKEEMLMLYHLKVGKKTHKEICEIMSEKIGQREYNENNIHKKWQQTNWEQWRHVLLKRFENER